MIGPSAVDPVHPSLAEFAGTARNRLGNVSPAQGRVLAAEAARDVLNRAITLDLKRLTPDEIALEFLEIRKALDGLLTVSVPAATPPPLPYENELTDEDLVDHLFDLISDAAPLGADVTVHVSRSLPDNLINSLVRAINAPGIRAAGEYVEAYGSCGTSSVQITAMAGGAR